MHRQRLPETETAVRRYVEALWLPYMHELADAVERHALTDDESVDIVAEQTEFRLEQLDSETHEVWVAVDTSDADHTTATDDPTAIDAPLVGFITTDVDECPTIFERPDRLVVGDFYVTEPYRGTGLARDLMAKAAERADHYDCGELRLDVDVDNERALAFYEKCGFEPYRYQMLLDADEL